MENQLLKEAKQMQEELSMWRQALHQIPELGLCLPQTMAFVKDKLDEMGITYQVYDDCSCLTACLGKGSKCFLLRSDMDGLPMAEESGEPFSSQNGNMHSCGHDLHTAVLLGAAKLLKAHEQELKGVVKLFFQSGEETFTGAAAAIKEGLLETPKVDAAFAMHVASTMANNVIIYGPQPMSAVYGFKITLTGKGAHGSTPNLGIDPINTGIHIYLGLQELIARETSSADEAALTIGRFSAGSASNIIPERAVMEGTLRTFKPEVGKYLKDRIHDIISSVCRTYRTTYDIEVLSDVPAVSCDARMIETCVESIHSLNGSVKTYPLYHVMGSEDFAFISEKVPAAYFCIGAGVEDKSKWAGQHNPKVLFTEECLPLGAAVYAKTAMDWLAKQTAE